MRPSEYRTLHDYTSASRDCRHLAVPMEYKPFGIVQTFIVGALVAVGLAMLYGHLSANDDAVVPVAHQAKMKCPAPEHRERVTEVEIDGALVKCVYAKANISGMRPATRQSNPE